MLWDVLLVEIVVNVGVDGDAKILLTPSKNKI
jgi:hypothetical protein